MKSGYLVRLVSADASAVFEKMNGAGIAVWDLQREDELSFQFRLSKEAYRKALSLVQTRGDDMQILHHEGLYWKLISALNRPVLNGCILAVLLLTFFLPTRVLFLQVQGNRNVPASKILEAAEICGVRFGASRKTLNSEQIKNQLIGILPELKWTGVNSRGCVTTITVRENVPENKTEEELPGSIVACTDGIVERVTTAKGVSQCVPGDAVSAGQILISGIIDCGGTVLIGSAKGEVIGQTLRKIRAVTPSEGIARLLEKGRTYSASLILGKKRINLWKGSGICHSSCGRMYKEYWLKLPGGFILPVCLTVEEHLEYEVEGCTLSQREALLSAFAGAYLPAGMLTGQILDADQNIRLLDDHWILEGEYLCREQLGVFQEVQIGEYYGKEH